MKAGYYLLAISLAMNAFMYMLCDSYAEDVAGYEYAIDYMATNPQELQEGMLEYCIDGMTEALDKGFIQKDPPALIKGC